MMLYFHNTIALLLCSTLLLASCNKPKARQESVPLVPDSNQVKTSENSDSFERIVADYESKDRVIWQKPDIVISQLGDLEGKTVADIGAGTGYFTFRLVPKAKKVIGIDIDQRFINFMDSVKVRLPEQFQKRFETRLAKPEDPSLQPGEADAAMIVNTYSYIENRINYLKVLHRGLTPKATLLVIDFKKNDLPVGPPVQYKVSSMDVEKELTLAGFEVTKVDKTTLDYQYIIVAVKK
jgi:ubiquinone/menaquinone biosynthesis C-methylase UbiE